MKSYMVLLAVGSDRPGLVERLSENLYKHNLNIEESRMAVLGGEMALIMLFSGEGESLVEIRRESNVMERDTGLKISLKETTPPVLKSVKPSLPYHIRATSMDHPGIVNRITGILSQYGINIEEMNTGVNPAPVSGTPVFHMEMRISVPSGCNIKEIKEGLSTLEDELNIDINISS